MTAQDLDNMEVALGFALPADYRAVMLAYPFPTANGGRVMLTNEPVTAADPSRLELISPDVSRPFIIGWAPREQVYYMDADRRDSPVFVRDRKSGMIWEFSPSLVAYVEHVKSLPPDPLPVNPRQRFTPFRMGVVFLFAFKYREFMDTPANYDGGRISAAGWKMIGVVLLLAALLWCADLVLWKRVERKWILWAGEGLVIVVAFAWLVLQT